MQRMQSAEPPGATTGSAALPSLAEAVSRIIGVTIDLDMIQRREALCPLRPAPHYRH